MKGLTFLLFCGCLSGFESSIILGQVHKIDIRPISDSFEQAEESRCRVACKEGLQAIKHHSLVTVAQLRIKSKMKRKISSGATGLSASQQTQMAEDNGQLRLSSFLPFCQLRASAASPQDPCTQPRTPPTADEGRLLPKSHLAAWCSVAGPSHSPPRHVPAASQRGWSPASPRAARSS